MLSWEDAQSHCQSLNKTLFQYDKIIDNLIIGDQFYSMAQDFSELMFIGLTRNKEVCG